MMIQFNIVPHSVFGRLDNQDCQASAESDHTNVMAIVYMTMNYRLILASFRAR